MATREDARFGDAPPTTGQPAHRWNDTVRQRAGFLSEASRQLAGTLDVRRTLLSALRIAVPALADWAALALFEAKATRLYSHGTDTLAAPVDADGRTAPLPAERSGLGEVRSTGRPVRLHLSAEASATGAALAGLIPDAELCEQATALGALEVLALPLSAGGRTFGALVLARSSEQLDARFSSEEMELAEDFVSRIAVTADAARLYEERAHIAAVLQSSLRPPALPEVPGVRLAARYRTAVEHIAIGGDFYDVHGSGDDWVLVIGDVCGKGVEAAVLTGRSRQTVRTVAHLDRSPARILSVLNEVLHDSDSDRFVTAVVARLRREPATGCARLDVATAGHPAPAVVRA
ncbi:MAG: PP2C family protein-serine/threonine phosphatase, partial [Sciscionella sp.]